MVSTILTMAVLAAWTPKAEAVSQHHWHATPCDGNVTFVARNLPGRWAQSELCTLVYDPRRHWTYPRFCHAVVHEFGHMLGYGHSTNPDDVMFPVLIEPIKECRK